MKPGSAAICAFRGAVRPERSRRRPGGVFHLVERLAMAANQLAGLGHVAEFLGQLQYGERAIGKRRWRGHLGSPVRLDRCGNRQSTDASGVRP